MSIIIYHNPSCSKSCETLALLESHQIQPQVELYLQKTYSVAELQAIADKLGISDIRQMMRTKDELYKELGLDNPTLSQQDLLQAIAQHSTLLERPIVINGDKAKIGRPPESVLSIL
ncbi:arsenate reductase (glutaredoxin) [Aggregatibacter actinomycetemcomitans]|uniref:arsenate reductase (glutaredoxin) n=1 Tax=Aggregatibacter actinomycetemcomitans TaxID=714 RepID=UPI00197C6B31|nr:arsenate reductase (glutaredoxin) [Aggregatibacter actinomycetemcomitans]MBN6063934.1 arsenate reductase (glutaredoxin) [Aggregatibacter actinomycetemcomitans]MBN6073698.1 arsenate reductase (glutaredoxin) [Aggregatibacter actinomycetemcomitans]MBN6083835.1 arsenate reductase (glutaredoxin) [Aggregatibacter actinomycetemcomitans]